MMIEPAVYDFASHNEPTNLETIELILRELRVDLKSWVELVPDRPNHDRRYRVDPVKAENELGFKSQISLEDGIRDTVQWYVRNPEWWQPIIERSGSLHFDWGQR